MSPNRTAPIAILASICLVVIIAPGYAWSFTVNPPLKLTRTLLRASNDFDEFALSSDADDGKDLAREFYKQVKKRELAERIATNKRSEDNDNATWEVNVKSSSRRKFTGRRGEIDSSGTPSAGLFASQNGTVYAFPGDQMKRRGSAYSSSTDILSPRDRMMRDEINFMRIASNELTLVVQAILVVTLLGFTLYIGSTGGITDGSDRFGAMEGVVNEFNGLGESIDFSSLINDDASAAAGELVKEGSLWL